MYVIKKDELNAEEMRKTYKRFEWLTSFMIVNYHFVHRILGMMVKTPTYKIETLGVRVLNGAQFELLWNPSFVNALEDNELTYVFFHEVLHLALHHCTSRRFDDPYIGNLATDLAVNELIPVQSGSCTPPRDKSGKLVGCHVSEMSKNPDFKELLPKQSAEWYYDFLRSKVPPPARTAAGDKGGGRDADKQQGAMDNQAAGDKGGGRGADKQQGAMDNHDGWKEDEVAAEKVRALVKDIASQNQWGQLGAGEQELIMAAQTRRLNWRNLIRRFYGNQVWREQEATRKRPNRRTGYMHPGYKKVHVDRHLVAVDTSGSIDSQLLSTFLSVLNGLVDYVPFDLMQFDWNKTTDPKPYEGHKTQLNFQGRGGTNFDPVMKEAEARHYKSVLILTDGCAGAPPQPRARVLWVLPQGCEPPVDWGKRVHMTRHD